MATHSSVFAWRAHGQGNLVGYSPQGHTELDVTSDLAHSQGCLAERGASPAKLTELCCPPNFLFLIINECSSTYFFFLLSQPSLGSSKQKGDLYNACQSREETQSLFWHNNPQALVLSWPCTLWLSMSDSN